MFMRSCPAQASLFTLIYVGGNRAIDLQAKNCRFERTGTESVGV